jgi:hypothetical protein
MLYREAYVKLLFWIGLIVLILGVVSLVVPVPDSQRESVTVGDLSIGVEVEQQEKVSPVISAVMILGGIGAMAASSRKRS